MQGEGADESEAVDVAEVDFAAEEEEGAEEEEEEDGACEVGVVHYVLGYWGEGVEDCECLWIFLVSRFLVMDVWRIGSCIALSLFFLPFP